MSETLQLNENINVKSVHFVGSYYVMIFMSLLLYYSLCLCLYSLNQNYVCFLGLELVPYIIGICISYLRLKRLCWIVFTELNGSHRCQPVKEDSSAWNPPQSSAG